MAEIKLTDKSAIPPDERWMAELSKKIGKTIVDWYDEHEDDPKWNLTRQDVFRMCDIPADFDTKDRTKSLYREEALALSKSLIYRNIVHTKEIKENPFKEDDNVNHPSHYAFGAIEVIDYIRDKLGPIEFQGYCEGNVLKYVSRWRRKGGVEDLEKAKVYLEWMIESAKTTEGEWKPWTDTKKE